MNDGRSLAYRRDHMRRWCRVTRLGVGYRCGSAYHGCARCFDHAERDMLFCSHECEVAA